MGYSCSQPIPPMIFETFRVCPKFLQKYKKHTIPALLFTVIVKSKENENVGKGITDTQDILSDIFHE